MNPSIGHSVRKSTQEEAQGYLRGYCRVCNRHYFFRHQVDTDHTQLHQHHAGVCQKCRYGCARIKPKPRIAVPYPSEGKAYPTLSGVNLGKKGP